MAEITVGYEAINRDGSTYSGNYTYVQIDKLANASGKINTVEIWANTNLAGCVAGLCFGSGTTWQARSYVSIGAVTSGAKRTYADLELDCEEGDVIAASVSGGRFERGTVSEATIKYGVGSLLNGDEFQTTSNYTSSAISLYGTGETVSAGGGGILVGSSALVGGQILVGHGSLIN
jgi:hypothetical protein